jgi:2-phosphosulfolactate phosphatase
MRAQIGYLLSGAEKARGAGVLIDVFRSSNTMLAMLDRGAEEIVQVKEVQDALVLKRRNPDWLLFGERDGEPPVGFDHGNSPVEASGLSLHGRTTILRTSAGSAGIWAMRHIKEIVIASFANAEAVVRYLKKNTGPDAEVTLAAIGKEAVERAPEDDLCAQYILDRLLDTSVDYGAIKAQLLASHTAQRLRNRDQQDDLDFCLRLDIFDTVPRVHWGEKGAVVR